MLGQRMMDVIIWARGKLLLLACDFGIVQSSLMSRLRIRSSQYTWAFFQSKSVGYCRLFLQPELKPFLYVGSTAQILKSSGPPGTPSSSTEMYIRRCVTHVK